MEILPADLDPAIAFGKSDLENPFLKIALTKLHCKYWVEFGEIGQIRKKGRIQEFAEGRDSKIKKEKKVQKRKRQSIRGVVDDSSVEDIQDSPQPTKRLKARTPAYATSSNFGEASKPTYSSIKANPPKYILDNVQPNLSAQKSPSSIQKTPDNMKKEIDFLKKNQQAMEKKWITNLPK